MNKLKMVIMVFSILALAFSIMAGERVNKISSSTIVLEGEYQTEEIKSRGYIITA